MHLCFGLVEALFSLPKDSTVLSYSDKAAFIMYDLVGGGRFFGGFQNFLVNIKGG